jgi:uncharacterized phage protein (TIGR01671 family)
MKDHHKMRAWSKLENKYLEPEEVLSILMLAGRIDRGAAEDKKNVLGNYVLEQCTGLKDKNGKLIYEGDLINLHYFSDYTGESDNEIKSARVYLDDCGVWCASNQKEGISIFKSSHFESGEGIEIIGNIHENKELLEK